MKKIISKLNSSNISFTVVFLSMVFVCMLFLLTFINFHKDKYKDAISTYIIVSESMEPSIRVNDAIVVKKVNTDKLEKGDVITFRSIDPQYYGLIVTHRIVKIEKTGDSVYFRTRGDNNILEDKTLVSRDFVYGKVLFKIPFIGSIHKFVLSRLGNFLLIILPFLYIVLYCILKILSIYRKSEV